MNIFDASTCCRYIECLLIIYGYFSQCAYALSGHVCSCHDGEWELSKRIFDAVKFSRRRFFWGGGGIISSYIRWWRARESFLLYSGCCWLSPVVTVFLTLRSWFRDLWHSRFLVCAVMLLLSSEQLLHPAWMNFGEWGSKKWLTWMLYVKGPERRHNQYGCHSGWKMRSLSGVKDNMEADERGAPDGLFREAWKNNSRVNLSVFLTSKDPCWPWKTEINTQSAWMSEDVENVGNGTIYVLYRHIFTKCYTRTFIDNHTSILIKHCYTHCFVWYTSRLVNLSILFLR